MAGALDGVRIFDLTRILAGPSCTQVLGELLGMDEREIAVLRQAGVV